MGDIAGFLDPVIAMAMERREKRRKGEDLEETSFLDHLVDTTDGKCCGFY